VRACGPEQHAPSVRAAAAALRCVTPVVVTVRWMMTEELVEGPGPITATEVELRYTIKDLEWRLETREREIRYLKVDIFKLKEMA
jgi:hypothetical protein